MIKINYYNILEQAYEAGNCQEIIECLNIITKSVSYKRKDLVFKSIYFIIQNGYLNEATIFLSPKLVLKKDEFKIDLLKKAVENEKRFRWLNDDLKEVFYKSLELGGNYYHKFDIYTAYDYYSWGYYMTKEPLFLYYMGKMYYKKRKYEEAESLLLTYIKSGSDKLAKAYLYLANIAQKNHNYFLADQYITYSKQADEVYGAEFDLIEAYYKCSDIRKNIIQNENILNRKKYKITNLSK